MIGVASVARMPLPPPRPPRPPPPAAGVGVAAAGAGGGAMWYVHAVVSRPALVVLICDSGEKRVLPSSWPYVGQSVWPSTTTAPASAKAATAAVVPSSRGFMRRPLLEGRDDVDWRAGSADRA